MLESAVV